MSEATLRAPFGEVRLSADGGTTSPWRDAAPAPADGRRVDVCRTAAVSRPAGDAAKVVVTLEWSLLDGFETFLDTGEALEASSIEGEGLIACVGMRDGVWIDARPGLGLISFEGGATRSIFEIEIDQGAAMLFTAAAAWTLNPKDENEEVGPWFAVDLVLPD